MLALDRPFIANFVDSNHEESQELCLEYGSATQVYMVPIAQQEEQVCRDALMVLSGCIDSFISITQTDQHVMSVLGAFYTYSIKEPRTSTIMSSD